MSPAPSGQVPRPGALNVDHVAHFVPHIDAASAALEKLGFTLTPFSVQSHRVEPGGPLVPAGTGNRCVMLGRGYLEFLTATGNAEAASPVASQLRAAIKRYVGVQLLAFGTAAPDIDHARLAKGGFEPLPPVSLQRPIETESGEDTARFTVVRVPPGAMAEGRIQFCQHHTPELLWQQRWMAHANHLSALTTVLICTEDPQQTAQRYARFTGLLPHTAGNAWRLDTARGAVVFIDPRQAERHLGCTPPALPWIAGYALATGNLTGTLGYLRQAGYAVRDLDPQRKVVTLPAALGGIAVIEPAGARPLTL